jgi:SAM-dependent methyltransferase
MHLPSLQTAAAEDALQTDDAEGARLFRADLARAGYTREGIDGAIHITHAVTRFPGDLPFLLAALADRSPLSTLVLLFSVGVPVPREDAERALAGAGVERLVAMRVLDADGPAVTATAALDPRGELVIASDWEPADREPDRPDHVIAPLEGTKLLRWLLPETPVGRVLDLGAGTGYLALTCAAHADAVVATDTSPRALRFARFNAALNGLADRVEIRAGSMFEPVAGERFDVVVSNPPYVVSPEAAYTFRDGGEGFCRDLVRGMPAHLEEGGLGVCLVSWTHRRDEDWRGPVRAWVEGSGCDAIVLGLASSDVLTYAAGWGRGPGRDPEVTAPRLVRWLEWFAAEGIEQVGWGAVVLRRRSGGPNWFLAETPATETNGPAGEQIRRLIAMQDVLQELPDEPEALLRVPLVLAPDHRVDQTGRFVADGSEIDSLTLRFEAGLGTKIALDLPTAQALAALDGRRPAGEVLREVGQRLGVDDVDGFARGAAPGFRRLLELGLVLPAGAGPS